MRSVGGRIEGTAGDSLTQLGNVICKPTEPGAWNEHAEVVSALSLRENDEHKVGGPMRTYRSSVGMSEKCASKASFTG